MAAQAVCLNLQLLAKPAGRPDRTQGQRVESTSRKRRPVFGGERRQDCCRSDCCRPRESAEASSGNGGESNGS